MNVDELIASLKQMGVKERAYDFEGSSKNEAYCLETSGDNWVTYYRERGLKQGTRQFDSEEKACDYLFQLISKDPTTRL